MLPPKIKLTSQLINELKAARVAKRFPAAALSKAIERDDSYISSLELGRLRSISSFDLVAVIGVLYDLSADEAENKAAEMIDALNPVGTGTGISTNKLRSAPDFRPGDGAIMVSEPAETAASYNAHTGACNSQPGLIADMIETMSGLLIEAYKENPREAIFALNSFIKTMEFDLDFAMDIMGMPFYVLKSLDAGEREKVLDDLMKVLISREEL